MRAASSVIALPTSTWPTAMSYLRPSSDAVLVRPSTACLVAVYAIEFGPSAAARPMPEPAPVTIAMRPLLLLSTLMLNVSFSACLSYRSLWGSSAAGLAPLHLVGGLLDRRLEGLHRRLRPGGNGRRAALRP